MVEHYFNAQSLHYLVKTLGRGALEKAVLRPVRAHSVYNLSSVIICVHLVHRVYVVLQVGVHGDNGVSLFFGRIQSRKQRVLVSAVARKFYALKAPVLFVQLVYNRPRAVL